LSLRAGHTYFVTSSRIGCPRAQAGSPLESPAGRCSSRVDLPVQVVEPSPGLLHVSLVEEWSQIALPRLLGEGVVADAAFVDGSHIFHNVFVDLFYLRELVRPGGLVILDDCSYLSVATAARYFEVNTGWESEPIAWPTRLRAFRLPKPRTEPSFESFRPFGLDATR